MVRLAGAVEADGRFGQLRQPDHQVDVGQRVVRQPAAAVAARVPLVDGAAVVEAPVEAVRLREVRFDVAADAAELGPGEAGDAERHGNEDREGSELHEPYALSAPTPRVAVPRRSGARCPPARLSVVEHRLHRRTDDRQRVAISLLRGGVVAGRLHRHDVAREVDDVLADPLRVDRRRCRPARRVTPPLSRK